MRLNIDANVRFRTIGLQPPKLSLNEQRVVLACIGQLDSTKKLLATDEFELSTKDFARLFSVSDENAYQALIDVIKSLFNRYVVVDNPYPDRPKVKRLEMRWISSIKHLPDDGKVLLMFAQDILPFLSEIKNTFTKYKLEHVGKMTCIYAIRLYELLMQWQTTGKREVEIDWLKKQFQLDEGYDRMNNFNSPFAQFYPGFVKLWQNIFFCRHGNTNTHNENRTGRRYSAAISADGQDEYSRVAGQAFSYARELARAKFRRNSGRVAGLYPERRRSSLELGTGLGGRNPDDTKRMSESGRLARIRF